MRRTVLAWTSPCPGSFFVLLFADAVALVLVSSFPHESFFVLQQFSTVLQPVWLVLLQFFGYSLPVFALAPHVLHVLPPKGEDMLRC